MKTNKTGYTLRAVVAAYIVYLGISLAKDMLATTQARPVPILLAIPVFILVGGAFLFISIKGLLRGEDGVSDEGKDSQNKDEEV